LGQVKKRKIRGGTPKLGRKTLRGEDLMKRERRGKSHTKHPVCHTLLTCRPINKQEKRTYRGGGGRQKKEWLEREDPTNIRLLENQNALRRLVEEGSLT